GTSSSASECALSADSTPPWQKMLVVQNTLGPNTPVGIITMWDGTLAKIPATWKNCDGSSGTPNLSQGKMIRGAANSGEIGNTGGSHTHGSVTSSSSGNAGHG